MKQRGSRLFVVAVVVAIASIVVAAILFRDRLRCAGFAGPGVSAAELPPPLQPGSLRVATWNIRNYPLDERPPEPDLGFARRTNICDLEDALRGLDADILGVAEIRDTRRFPPILRRAGGHRRYSVMLSGPGSPQHLGIAWDNRRLELRDGPIEVREVALDGGLRPALAVYLAGRDGRGLDLTVVQVHLKSAPDGYPLRLRQYRALADWVAGWVDSIGDEDVVVMGDFNTTGEVGGTVDDELAVADRILGRAGLRRLENATGCSQYWEGPGQRDGVQLPSLLDHVWVRGLGRIGSSSRVRAWLHCERMQCQDLVSQAGAEDGTFWDVSDHCPITVDVPGVQEGSG